MPALGSTRIHPAPLTTDGLVYATQPGVWAVECIESASGRLRWRRTLGALVRLVGLHGGRLIALAGDDLVGIAPASGEIVWTQSVKDHLDLKLTGGPDAVLSIRRAAPTRGKPAELELTWIDAQRGKLLARSIVVLASEGEFDVGPVVSAPRQWVFMAKAQEPARREILELVRTGDLSADEAIPLPR